MTWTWGVWRKMAEWLENKHFPPWKGGLGDELPVGSLWDYSGFRWAWMVAGLVSGIQENPLGGEECFPVWRRKKKSRPDGRLLREGR